MEQGGNRWLRAQAAPASLRECPGKSRHTRPWRSGCRIIMFQADCRRYHRNHHQSRLTAPAHPGGSPLRRHCNQCPISRQGVEMAESTYPSASRSSQPIIASSRSSSSVFAVPPFPDSGPDCGYRNPSRRRVHRRTRRRPYPGPQAWPAGRFLPAHSARKDRL